MKRFQECNKLIQIWRYRFYLLIPIYYILGLLKSKIYKTKFHGKLYWSLLIGEAQIKMKWYYTSEEVFERLKNKRCR